VRALIHQQAGSLFLQCGLQAVRAVGVRVNCKKTSDQYGSDRHQATRRRLAFLNGSRLLSLSNNDENSEKVPMSRRYAQLGAQLYLYAKWLDPYWRNVVVEWTFAQAVIRKRRSACEVMESDFYPRPLGHFSRVLPSYRTEMVSFVIAFIAQRSSP
jgi:hypothetical protein